MSVSRLCVCGVPIPANRKLCCACAKYYTLRRAAWPEWLRVWMSHYQRELDYELRHDDIPLGWFDGDGDNQEDSDCN